MTHWIPLDEWATVVRHVPIVSVDLVVRCDGGVVLGKRCNEPAKGEWFVPGGRVHKGERLCEAVHRVAREELGIEVEIVAELGTYEHFWDASDVSGSDGKHYVTNGFVVEADADGESLRPDDQHDRLEAFPPEAVPGDVHEYTASYLRDAADLDI